MKLIDLALATGITLWFVFLLVVMASGILGYLKDRKRRKNKEKAERRTKGIKPVGCGKNPAWIWSGETNLSVMKDGVIMGQHAYREGSIFMYLGSTMRAADGAEEAIAQMEETVLHELTHWACQHKGQGRHADNGHSERYREVLKPIVESIHDTDEY